MTEGMNESQYCWKTLLRKSYHLQALLKASFTQYLVSDYFTDGPEDVSHEAGVRGCGLETVHIAVCVLIQPQIFSFEKLPWNSKIIY